MMIDNRIDSKIPFEDQDLFGRDLRSVYLDYIAFFDAHFDRNYENLGDENEITRPEPMTIEDFARLYRESPDEKRNAMIIGLIEDHEIGYAKWREKSKDLSEQVFFARYGAVLEQDEDNNL